MEFRLLRRTFTGGFQMLGPLPTLHRLALVAGALVVCLGIGFWFGVMPEIPVNVGAGLLAGAAIGAAAAFVLVHDFHHRQTRSARVRRSHP